MKNPSTETKNAPDTATIDMPITPTVPQQRRRPTIERQGNRSEPYTEYWPQVRGGICEFCGVIDGNVESRYQYKLCQHFRGMELRCSYCDETKNPDDIVEHSVLNIHGHPDNPDKLVVVCNAYTCSQKHIERFKRS